MSEANGKSAVTATLVWTLTVIGSIGLMCLGVGAKTLWDHESRMIVVESFVQKQIQSETDDRFRRNEWLVEKELLEERFRKLNDRLENK